MLEQFSVSHPSDMTSIWLQADDGYVYPLERAFFYVQKPPLLLVFDDIDSLEFMRQAQGRPHLLHSSLRCSGPLWLQGCDPLPRALE